MFCLPRKNDEISELLGQQYSLQQNPNIEPTFLEWVCHEVRFEKTNLLCCFGIKMEKFVKTCQLSSNRNLGPEIWRERGINCPQWQKIWKMKPKNTSNGFTEKNILNYQFTVWQFQKIDLSLRFFDKNFVKSTFLQSWLHEKFIFSVRVNFSFSTLCNSQCRNFAAILILRAINFGCFQKTQNCHFHNFWGFEFRVLAKFHIWKCQNI